MMMGLNDISRGEFRKMIQLPFKVSCLLQEVRIYLNPTVLTICTLQFIMLLNDNRLSMNERERHIKEVIFEVQRNSFLPLRLLDVARMMGDSLPDGCSSDGIHLDEPKT